MAFFIFLVLKAFKSTHTQEHEEPPIIETIFSDEFQLWGYCHSLAICNLRRTTTESLLQGTTCVIEFFKEETISEYTTRLKYQNSMIQKEIQFLADLIWRTTLSPNCFTNVCVGIEYPVRKSVSKLTKSDQIFYKLLIGQITKLLPTGLRFLNNRWNGHLTKPDPTNNYNLLVDVSMFHR